MNHRILLRKNDMEFYTFEDILPEKDSVLDMLIVGKVPAPTSVSIGYYFQGKHGKAMWNKLTEYKILNKVTTYHDDSLLKNNMGITDIVKEPRKYGTEPDFGEYIIGKERVISIIEKYTPKVIFFVYKPILEAMVPFTAKVNYGFNDHLNCYFNESRVFLFPMPGTGKVTKPIIEKAMNDLKKCLGRE